MKRVLLQEMPQSHRVRHQSDDAKYRCVDSDDDVARQRSAKPQNVEQHKREDAGVDGEHSPCNRD